MCWKSATKEEVFKKGTEFSIDWISPVGLTPSFGMELLHLKHVDRGLRDSNYPSFDQENKSVMIISTEWFSWAVWQQGNLNWMLIHQQDMETPHGTGATVLVLPEGTEGRNLTAQLFLLFSAFLWLDQSEQSSSTPVMGVSTFWRGSWSVLCWARSWAWWFL